MRPTLTLLCVVMLWSPVAGQTAEDPYRWLEEVEGEAALAWVASHNEQTLAALQAYPAFEAIYSKNLEIFGYSEDLSVPQIRGDYVYDLWQDEEHERGLWRRTLLDSYVSGETSWETLLDLDSLGVAEGTEVGNPGRWFCLPPEYTRCMVSLSRGGRDAAAVKYGGADATSTSCGSGERSPDTRIVTSNFQPERMETSESTISLTLFRSSTYATWASRIRNSHFPSCTTIYDTD